MDSEQLFLQKQKKFWVSITGYRALLILKALMQAPCSLNELIEILKTNSVTNKAVSKDTIRITLNTLKSAGCKFSRPNKTNGFKYSLEYHPFCLTLSNEEIFAFTQLRNIVCENLNWQSIIKINNLYEKIIQLTENSEQIETINNTKVLCNVNENILQELSNPKLAGKKLKIKYLSSQNGLETLDIIPFKFVYENKKMYLWCYIFKYSSNTLLKIENIKEILSVSISQEHFESDSFDVIYQVRNISKKDFELKDYEEFIEKTPDYVTIKANVTNEFWFIQRILQLGTNFKIISPTFFKEKLINKIKLIQQRYK